MRSFSFLDADGAVSEFSSTLPVVWKLTYILENCTEDFREKADGVGIAQRV